MNTYRKKNYRNKRNYSGRPRRTVDNYHQPAPPERESIPVSRHTLTKPDVEAVVEALLSGTLVKGQELDRFESLLAKLTHSDHAIAVTTGTAALHAALACLKLEQEDEVITSTLNDFSAANMIRLVGATPVLVDCDPQTLTMNVEATKAAINDHTKAILANNFAGHPADLTQLREICEEHNLVLIEDASHGLGGKHRGHYVGNQADITCFSFQPSMAITTCQGGAITTNNRTIADWIRQFCNQGLPLNDGKNQEQKLQFPGMNYRLNDVLAALGRSQLTRLDRHIERRRSIAQVYQQKLSQSDAITLPHVAQWVDHAYHLYPIQLVGDMAGKREKLLADLKHQGINTVVQFTPLHQVPAYSAFATSDSYDHAEAFFNNSLCLPLYPDLSYKDIERITDQLLKLIAKYNPKPEPVEVKEDPAAGETETKEAETTQEAATTTEPTTEVPKETTSEEANAGATGKKPTSQESEKAPAAEEHAVEAQTEPSADEAKAEASAVAESEADKPEEAKKEPTKKPARRPRRESSRLRKVPKEEEGENNEEAKETPKRKPRATSKAKATTRSRTKTKKAAAEPEGVEEAVKEKPKRTRTTRKTAAKTEDGETKPRTRRTRTKKATTEASGEGTAKTEPKKAKPRTTTRKRTTKKKVDAEEAES